MRYYDFINQLNEWGIKQQQLFELIALKQIK